MPPRSARKAGGKRPRGDPDATRPSAKHKRTEPPSAGVAPTLQPAPVTTRHTVTKLSDSVTTVAPQVRFIQQCASVESVWSWLRTEGSSTAAEMFMGVNADNSGGRERTDRDMRVETAIRALLDVHSFVHVLRDDDCDATGGAATPTHEPVAGFHERRRRSLLSHNVFRSSQIVSKKPPTSVVDGSVWVDSKHAPLIPALVELSNAAVPFDNPLPLRSVANTSLTTTISVTGLDNSSRAAELVPAPFSLSDLQERIVAVKRIGRLYVRDGNILNPLRSCKSCLELNHIFFSHKEALSLVSPLSVCVGTEPGAVLRRGQLSAPFCTEDIECDSLGSLSAVWSDPTRAAEAKILQDVVRCANQQCGADAAAWGSATPVAALRIEDGVCVHHHVSRRAALRELLSETLLYGLPPILRSIRRTSALSVGRDGAAALAAGLSRSFAQAGASTPSLFLSPESLDPVHYGVAPPMSAPMVREELQSLCRQHLRYGAVVGCADDVLALYAAHTRHVTAVWRRRVATVKRDCGDAAAGSLREVKREGADGDAPTRAEDSVAIPPNPLLPYALELSKFSAVPSRTDSGSGASMTSNFSTRVQWLECNRWATRGRYCALIYSALHREENDLRGWDRAAPLTVNDDDHASDAATGSDVVFYVCALVQLVRD